MGPCGHALDGYHLHSVLPAITHLGPGSKHTQARAWVLPLGMCLVPGGGGGAVARGGGWFGGVRGTPDRKCKKNIETGIQRGNLHSAGQHGIRHTTHTSRSGSIMARSRPPPRTSSCAPQAPQGRGIPLSDNLYRIDVPRIWVQEVGQTGTTARHSTQKAHKRCDHRSPFKSTPPPPPLYKLRQSPKLIRSLRLL